jgi:hypothetical protein
LFGSNGATPAETGLSINSAGQITFASGQTFPGAGSGTITGVTAGTDLAGGGTSGNVTLNLDITKVPQLNAANAFTGNQTVSGSVTATTFLGDGSQLTNVNAATATLATTATTATNALALNGLPSSAFQPAGAYATTGANTFTGDQNVTGNVIASGNVTTSGNVTATGSISGGTGAFSGALSAAGATLPFTGPATQSQGTNSNPLDLQASAFNSTTSLPVSQDFRWLAQPVANDTSSPSGSLNLLFGSNGVTPVETGLSINSAGQITFATGQTFPGAGTGTITGVTAGTDLTGGGTSGNVTLSLNTTQVPTLGAPSNIFSGGITAASFSGNGANLTNVNAAELGGSLPSAFQPAGSYATTGANAFTGNQTVTGQVSAAGIVEVDSSGSNNGIDLPGIQFGASNSGETISSNRLGQGTKNQYGLDFYTGYNVRVSITNSGQVGIGTQTPSIGAALESDGARGCYSNCPSPNGGPGGNFNGGLAAQTNEIAGNGGVGIVATGGSTQGQAPANGGAGGTFTGGASAYAGSAGDGIDAYYNSNYYGSQSNAGSFFGNVWVTETLTASSKNFKIDHPLDPADKYLYHASVESSEMMNIYTGNVTTDGNGDAVVRLPDWFEALNGDFRYQLTVIGQFAQAIVASEISNHQFSIKTDKPGVKVSWQVTGVRHDAYAEAHPLQVEVEKSQRERGYYIDPKLYGAPDGKAIEWALHPDQMKQVQAERRKAGGPEGAPQSR